MSTAAFMQPNHRRAVRQQPLGWFWGKNRGFWGTKEHPELLAGGLPSQTEEQCWVWLWV